ADETRHGWHIKLPDEVRANNKAETDIVVCVSEERKNIVENCPYYDDNNNRIFSVNRVQRYHDIFLLNAETGGLIRTFQVTGGMPGTCPETKMGERGKADTINGSQPEYDNFWYQLRQVIY
ncbi:MAG: hypothetical protein JXQ72_12395, partial [Anaerolineae bacterium]|nr:hypothetical protein [Anaerolineae bacterium]